ncbi:trypsin-like peptidase domain-containing protein [Streptomyces showdoensis]|uniref:Protease n=1 Tax=Streptomyces showdoensis TaxID=68268 RepID=A0A2P2GG53_STREW|nr:trypsin-like peptidase domain-containing protein [Streptomyces showdoensis]KKZ69829.1 protease [Streptomyces showdoensis]
MKNGKPTWWSRPSTTPIPPPEQPPAPSPDAAGARDGDADFTLAAPAPTPAPAPQPSPDAAEARDAGSPPAGPEDARPAPAEAGTGRPEAAPDAPVLSKAPAPAAEPSPVPAPAAEQADAPASWLDPEPGPESVDPRRAVPGRPDQVPAGPDPTGPLPATPAAETTPAAPTGSDAAAAPATSAEPAAPAAPAPAPVPAQPEPQPQAQPLHAPDPYRTPPYGEPGPWAPAPPVQRPMAVAPAYDPWAAAAPLAAGPIVPPVTVKQKKPRRGLALVGALAFALVTGVVGGGVGAYIERNGGLTTVELPQAGPESSGRAPDSVAGIAAGALPGVVTIHVSGSGSSGTGTGFVLDTRGNILTNNHVVDAAAASGEISVTFSNGESARAKLIGRDTGYDLAVIRVSGVSGLKPLPLGNSDTVRVGDPVVAIGAPFDLSNTVTSGIISAKERPITAGGEKGDGTDISYVDALQTDAPINPGNSGGPLLDSQGRVIGINSAIRAASNGSESGGQSGSIGLGFAIPVNQGKRVAEELINSGKATHPVIGVSLDMQYTGDGARVGAKGKDGASSVTPDGPAARAGIKPGDVITKVDGQRVHSGEELIVKIRAHRPGDRLKLTLTRDGKEQTKTLTLGSSTGA